MAISSFGNNEIPQIADAVAREKNIPRELVMEAMESSIAIAARKKYGHEKNIKSEIDRKTGEIKLFREFEIVADDYANEEGDLDVTKIKLTDAKNSDDSAIIGGVIKEQLPPIDLIRVAAQAAKQVIVQKIRDAERERQYNDFKSRVGEIVHGTVKRLEFGNVIVDLGNAEAIIKKDSIIKGESFRINERIRAYLKNVAREQKGPQIFLSRTANEFLAKLFTQEVPEIYDGIIQVKAVAREPGSRAKIAVYSSDSNIDPVGSCVGVRGARVQAVINELHGEKIDIIQWSADPAVLIVNALSPAEVAKVVIDEENGRIEAVVPDDQLSLAIGRKGQNVRLASEILKWKIGVLTEEQESTRRSEEFTRLSKLFVESLNIEDIIAHLLVTEGFNSVEDIAYVSLQELSSVEGFDEDVARELQNRAKEFLSLQKKQKDSILTSLEMEGALLSVEGLSPDILIRLGSKNIKSLDDFADLSRDEFNELIPDSGLNDDRIDEIIMKARSHWFNKNEGEASN